MRCFNVSAGIVVLVSSISSAVAEETIHRDYGISYGGSTGLAIRKLLSESTQIYAGVGYSHYQNDGAFYGTNTNNYALTLGARRALSTGVLSKFVDVELTGTYTRTAQATGQSAQSASVFAAYGIEYFVAANLSIEGKAGVQYRRITYLYDIGDFSFTDFTFPKSALAVTYYW